MAKARHGLVDGGLAVQDRFDTRDLSWRTGTEIIGIDLSREASIPGEVIDELYQLVSERGILLFRGQTLDHDQQLAFTRRFGPLAETGGIGRFSPPGYPDIFRLTNQLVDGERSETVRAAIQWHSDQSMMRTPAMGSLLYCAKAPPVGGNTMFANMYQAFETLSEGLQSILVQLRAEHTPYNTRGITIRTLKPHTESERQKMVGSIHPVVRRHPVTGKPALYVSDMMVDHFGGWTVEESKPTLDFLHLHATQPAFTYRHAWQPGDLIFWDNRCMLHCTPVDYDPEAMDDPANERLMFRSTLAGDAPMPWAADGA